MLNIFLLLLFILLSLPPTESALMLSPQISILLFFVRGSGVRGVGTGLEVGRAERKRRKRWI